MHTRTTDLNPLLFLKPERHVVYLKACMITPPPDSTIIPNRVYGLHMKLMQDSPLHPSVESSLGDCKFDGLESLILGKVKSTDTGDQNGAGSLKMGVKKGEGSFPWRPLNPKPSKPSHSKTS